MPRDSPLQKSSGAGVRANGSRSGAARTSSAGCGRRWRRSQRHVAVVYAVVRRLDLPAAVSHQSAVARYDLPTWGLDLSLVHVTRGDLHSPRLEGGVHHHAGQLPQEDVRVVDGIVVTAPARTAIDTARVTSFEPSVVVADAILNAVAAASQKEEQRGAR